MRRLKYHKGSESMITTLLFDLGGTLHDVYRTDAAGKGFAEHVLRRLHRYGIDLFVTPEELLGTLSRNAEAYKQRGEKDLTELAQPDIWNDWYLKEYRIGREKLEPIAEELSFLYDYERVENVRKPRLRETVETLHEMGIRMGMISNIISTSVVPHMLIEYGIDQYMECIVMSSDVGIRKPDPRIFEVALKKMGVSAEETGYVGDTISRDVIGAHNAGLGLNIRINNPRIAHRDVKYQGADIPKPDYVIEQLYELPEIIRKVNQQ